MFVPNGNQSWPCIISCIGTAFAHALDAEAACPGAVWKEHCRVDATRFKSGFSPSWNGVPRDRFIRLDITAWSCGSDSLLGLKVFNRIIRLAVYNHMRRWRHIDYVSKQFYKHVSKRIQYGDRWFQKRIIWLGEGRNQRAQGKGHWKSMAKRHSTWTKIWRGNW